MIPFVLATSLLVLLDLYVSHIRIKTYGPRVELNPVARQLAADHGTKFALAFLAFYNILALVLVSRWPTCLHVFFGAKLGLAAMQLKSLEVETFVEKLLRKAKEKRNV